MCAELSKEYFCGKTIIDGFFQIKKADEEFYRFTGDKALYNLSGVIHADDLYKLTDVIAELETVEISFAALRILRFDGKYRWAIALVSYEELELEGKKLISFEFKDLTTIKSEMDEIKNCDEIYEEYFSLMESFMVSYDPESDLFKIFMIGSQQKVNLYNGTLTYWKNKKIDNQDFGKDEMPAFERLCNSFANSDKSFKCEINIRLFPEDSSVDCCLIKGKTIVDYTGKEFVIAVISKINPTTKKPKANLTLETSRDAGTDLINKRVIMKYAENLLNSKPSTPVTFLFIDLDNFKSINDTYGHMFGDDVLCKVAEILKEAVGDSGVVGRIGGDEFFVVLENIEDENELRRILRIIRINVEWAYKTKLKSLSLSCSMGTATYPKDAKDYKSLFNIADKCMYIAKENGKNRYIVFNKELYGKYIESPDNLILRDKDIRKYDKVAIFNDIMENFLYNKTMTLDEACEKIGLCFELEDISVFQGARMERTACWGNFMDADLDGSYLNEAGYAENFDNNHVFVIDHVNSLEFKANAAYETLTREKIRVSVQYLMGEKEAPKGYVTFSKSKKSPKWSEIDINYLGMLGKLFEMVLFK